MTVGISNITSLNPSVSNQSNCLFMNNSSILLSDKFSDEAVTSHLHEQFFSDDNLIGVSSDSKNPKDSFGETLYDSQNEIFIFDADTFKFLDVNKGALLNIGYSLAELKKLTPLDIKPEFHINAFKELVCPLKNSTQKKIVFTTTHRRKDGTTYPAEIHLELLYYNDTPALIALSLDVTAHKQKQEELESLAYYDDLTGLPNRVLFADRFKLAIAQSKRKESLLAVCFIDLDNFKPINDNFGHQVGDQLLLEVAKRIQAEIREEDTISRLGGDEFILLIGGIKSFAQCKQMLERIHHSLSLPYLIEGHPHRISASTGVTVYPLDESDKYNLVCHADEAMYQAKKAGKNQFHFYNAFDAGKSSK